MSKGKLLSILATLIVVTSSALVLLLFKDKIFNSSSIKNKNMNVESNAIKDDDTDVEKMKKSENGGAVSIEFLDKATIKNNEIKFYIKNPYKSREKMKLLIYINNKGNDELIAESGLVPPGYHLENLTITKKYKTGDYKGHIIIEHYDEETEKKQDFNSKINLKIKVEG